MNTKIQIPSNIYRLFVILFSTVMIILITKGNMGKPIYFQKELDTKLGGPFETSNSTARYALTKAIVDSHTVYFNDSLARFSAPDLVYYKNHYFSIFLPGISFVAAPFYWIGKQLGYPQLTSYIGLSLFSILNLLLVSKIAKKLGATNWSSFLAGFISLFATFSLSYSVTFTQHEISLTIFLLAILNLFGERNLLKDIWLGILIGAAGLIDVPNVLMLIPAVSYALLRHISVIKERGIFKLNLKLIIITIIIGLAPLVGLLGWYNLKTAGSWTKIGQFIGQSKYPAAVSQQNQIQNQPVTLSEYDKKLPLDTRSFVNGLYILLISDERGIFYYSPILLIGVLGLIVALRSRHNYSTKFVIFSMIISNILIYAMFHDPWGGWSFGPRYLIPTAGFLSIFIALALDKYKQSKIFTGIFFALVVLSLYINFLGVLTTAAIPPKQEAEHLVTKIPYTYEYNQQLIAKNFDSSLAFNLIFHKYISSAQYLYLLVGLMTGVFALIYLQMLVESGKENRNG